MQDELITLAERMIEGHTHDDRSHRLATVGLLLRRAAEAATTEEHARAMQLADRLDNTTAQTLMPPGLSTI